MAQNGKTRPRPWWATEAALDETGIAACGGVILFVNWIMLLDIIANYGNTHAAGGTKVFLINCLLFNQNGCVSVRFLSRD